MTLEEANVVSNQRGIRHMRPGSCYASSSRTSPFFKKRIQRGFHLTVAATERKRSADHRICGPRPFGTAWHILASICSLRNGKAADRDPGGRRYHLLISDMLGLHQARSFAGIGNHPRRGAHQPLLNQGSFRGYGMPVPNYWCLAMSSRTAGTRSRGTFMTVSSDSAKAASSSATASSGVCCS